MERICPQCEYRTASKSCPHDGFRTVAAARYASDGSDPLVGTVFQERYRIEERIGGGGMGTVYRAEQLAVGRAVAVKILHGRLMDDLKEVARFQQEARIVASLKHPNTIRLVDFGETDDCDGLFLVTELLDGEPLAELISREAPLAAKRVATIGLQILRALIEAHQRGIVHRDLKPHNIFVSEVAGQRDHVKVLDFGVAKVSATQELSLTTSGVAVGSPRYMSPEQVRAKRVTGKSDLYSLGCVLYEMLTGRPLFHFKTAIEYVQAHVKLDPPRPSANGEALRRPLVDFVMRCLAKSPAERPANAAVAAAELEDMLAGSGPRREPLDPRSRAAAPPLGRTPHDAFRRVSKTAGGLRPATVQLHERVSQDGFVDMTASEGAAAVAPLAEEAELAPDGAGTELPPTITLPAAQHADDEAPATPGLDEANEPLPATLVMGAQTSARGALADTLPATAATASEASAATDEAGLVTTRRTAEAEMTISPASRTWLWLSLGVAAGAAIAVSVLVATG